MNISVVIPAFNEAENIPALFDRLRKTLASLDCVSSEVIVVDDHSSDRTSEAVMEERRKDPTIKLIRLSRNSGSHVALYAGLSCVSGDVAVTMSADLQDPPEILPKMLSQIRSGKNIVWAVRESREDGWVTRARGRLYNLFFKRFILPGHTGADHFMMDRLVIDALRNHPEKNSSLMALVCWMGFSQGEVGFHRAQRQHGSTKWTFWKTNKMILDSILSFSYLPIRFMSFFGFIMSFFGFIYILVILYRNFFLGIHGVSGWGSLMVACVFLSGVQMFMLGIVGEYIWRIFEEVRKRPLYLIERKEGFQESGQVFPRH